MCDLIDRQAVLNCFHSWVDKRGDVHAPDEMPEYEAIEALPTIEERKKGKWKIEEMNTFEMSYGTTGYEPVYRCSVCERVTESYFRYEKPIMPEDADFPRFCPNCGADMRGEDNGKENTD